MTHPAPVMISITGFFQSPESFPSLMHITNQKGDYAMELFNGIIEVISLAVKAAFVVAGIIGTIGLVFDAMRDLEPRRY